MPNTHLKEKSPNTTDFTLCLFLASAGLKWLCNVTARHNPLLLKIPSLIWSSNCHLKAIRWSSIRSVWYHGWIVPNRRIMTQWLAYQVWVVTLVGAATPHPGNPWKPCFRTPWDQTQILQPHALNLTSANIAPHHPTHIYVSFLRSCLPCSDFASAIIVVKYFTAAEEPWHSKWQMHILAHSLNPSRQRSTNLRSLDS